MDLHSFSIWSDYIQFLKSFEPIGSFAENQKITAIRKVYQKAVLTPIIGIEVLWKEYIAFEHNINPVISEKMSLERSRDYMNARRVAKELENVTKGLNRNLPAVPPTLTKEEFKQVSRNICSKLLGSLSFRFSRSNYGESSLTSRSKTRFAVKTPRSSLVESCLQLNSVCSSSVTILTSGSWLLNTLTKQQSISPKKLYVYRRKTV